MPINVRNMDRGDPWRICNCFHVKTVTIFFGVWYLIIYLVALSLIAAMTMHEPKNEQDVGQFENKESAAIPLPTQVQLRKNSNPYSELPSKLKVNDTSGLEWKRMDDFRNGPLYFLLDTAVAKANNSQIALLTICNFLITLLMVYGALRGKPSYLMPFFILKVFNFCVFCLTMVGYFSYLNNITKMISKYPNFIYRKELLQMDPQILSMIILVMVVAFVSAKAYMIVVIWSCYKYLIWKNTATATVRRDFINYRNGGPVVMRVQENPFHPDADLPDYDTAVNDPRYAKKPETDEDGTNENLTNQNFTNQSTAVTIATRTLAPPSYSVAVNETPADVEVNQELVHGNETSVKVETENQQDDHDVTDSSPIPS